MTLRDLARKVLAESLLPLTAKQVWETAVKQGLDKQADVHGKTPDASLASYLYTECKKPGSGIVATGSKPSAFSLVATARPGTTSRGSGAQPPSEAIGSCPPLCFTACTPELTWVWYDLLKSIDDLYRLDAKLFEIDISERCLVASLAKHLWIRTQTNMLYLKKSVQWDVEYNRHEGTVKCVQAHRRTPDLLLHMRGTDEWNLCAIEVKKHRPRFFDNKSNKDFKVLQALTSESEGYRYRTGLFLVLKQNKVECYSFPEHEWHTFVPPLALDNSPPAPSDSLIESPSPSCAPALRPPLS